jgi:hypothetical protein
VGNVKIIHAPRIFPVDSAGQWSYVPVISKGNQARLREIKPMSNMPKLSARALIALNVLSDGGHFRYGLERNSYTGREQFQWRLQKNGKNVKGVGGATYYELEAAGFQFKKEWPGMTSTVTYHTLKHTA